MGKTTIKRLHLLEEQRKRRELLKEKERPDITFGQFLLTYKNEVIILTLIIAALLIWPHFKPKNEQAAEIATTVEELQKDELHWMGKYIQGYKLICVYKNKIYQTKVSSLPVELKINWNETVISLTEPSPVQNEEAKIKVKLAGLTYSAANINDLTAKVSFIRRQGASAVLTKLGEGELHIELLADYGDRMFFILGIK